MSCSITRSDIPVWLRYEIAGIFVNLLYLPLEIHLVRLSQPGALDDFPANEQNWTEGNHEVAEDK